ncbi:DUF262 domain-containing protein [Leeuwenhoekiella sp. UBA6783]|uniref:DUF262 domain-containing protein n=1 Tax=Leeuwenhoekiella sp. UBA6783 TaxID=1946747 RepID=UPI0025C5AD3F|nr:DUF262 domain-containing protein [Leeuwenhoekiella sp. UBA6783]|tara:strand:- start:6079 stop:7899 length:1821 start_codon:yes stop_codon:yes gene_type:complete
MENVNLEKTINQIFEEKYIVPLYQRNYAWGLEEIQQLLQDIYESFKKNSTGNYFIGSLIVLKRRNGDFEVIDGQQRLTTLSLIAKKLDSQNLKNQKLFFDSRPEVENFLSHYYQSDTISDSTNNHLISHFKAAVEFIDATNLDSKSDVPRLLKEMSADDFTNFKEYFFNNVILVRVEIPNDTDVAHYFEVMNNRGEQLEKHEILKATMLEKLSADEENSILFSKIWDACSQMNSPLQSMFGVKDRVDFFGEAYDDYTFKIPKNNSEDNDNQSNCGNQTYNINDILSDNELKINDSETKEGSEKNESIIDFPNFLMHVLQLHLRKDVPLNGDELIDEFRRHEADIKPMEFIHSLFFYRTVFDRYIIKTFEDEDAEDQYKWSLLKPALYHYDERDQDRLIYKNTFEKQDRIIKGLSMLQVTFRTKKYKNWLQEVLSWFDKDIHISKEKFQNKLDTLILNTFNSNELYRPIFDDVPLALGTATPHFLFNFIDYLMWVKGMGKHNFEFKYRNSVEHHLSQSARNENNEKYIHHLGNLCLVSKGGNSKMNNESPVGKAKVGHKYYREDLPPKQKRMYDLTNSNSDWGPKEILEHYDELKDLLSERKEILGL